MIEGRPNLGDMVFASRSDEVIVGCARIANIGDLLELLSMSASSFGTQDEQCARSRIWPWLARIHIYPSAAPQWPDLSAFGKQQIGGIRGRYCHNYRLATLVLGNPFTSKFHQTAGLFNAQYMTRIARMARMPPKAMRWRPSVTL